MGGAMSGAGGRPRTAGDWGPIARKGRQIMIFITAKFLIKPAHADQWPGIAAAFTGATRAEPGCLWFDWSRSVEDPDVYVLVEAFADDEAGGAHVQSEHFRAAQRELPPHLQETPRIVNSSVPGTEWSELGEMAVGTSDQP